MDFKQSGYETITIGDINLDSGTYTNTSAVPTIDLSSINSDTITLTNGTIGAIGNGGTGLGTMIYATDNTAGYSWNTGLSPTTISQSGRLSLQGEQADIEVNGHSMSLWMQRVEERLNILTPNPELEKEWDDLRRLGERYRKLEKKCKEKAEVWKKLKHMPPPKAD